MCRPDENRISENVTDETIGGRVNVHKKEGKETSRASYQRYSAENMTLAYKR